MIGASEIGIGLIGYGYWGPNLARNLHGLPGARLLACADALPERLREAQRLYPQIRTFTDYRDLLSADDIHAVVVATPARSHFMITKESLECDKHVLVEKPLAMSSMEARELVALAQAQRRVLLVGHTFEYNQAVVKVKDLIDARTIGDVYYIYSTRANLGRIQRDINVLWSIAPHDISIMLYLLGQMPLEVSARGATYLNHQIEDVVFITLSFLGGVLGHIHASWLDSLKVRSMTIVGSEKMIVYDDVDSEARLRIYDKGVSRQYTGGYGEYHLKLHSGDIHIPRIDMSEPLRNECAHFVDCIRTGQHPRTDGANGLRVVQVLEAAQASLAQGGASVSLS